jgi:alkylation response protein AidB-like acyl-CoA dehydrogenase
MLGLLALGVSSVSLGIGFKALEAFKQLAGSKTPTGGVKGLAERGQVQSIVGESTADLESAEAYIHEVIGQAYEMASQGRRLPTEMKASLRLAAVNATHRSVAAVDRLYKAGGGSSIYENSVLQRCFRDVHVTTQHIMVASPIYEVVGRVNLGLEPRSLL